MEPDAEETGAPESIGENKIWYLKKNRLFANAPVEAVVDGAGIFTMELLPKRATFFDQGDANKVVFLIKTGRVRIARNTADGKEVTVAILGPGDMFGEDALFGGTERTTVATCMEETLICKAHADDLFALLAGNSALALNVAQMLSDRLGDASATIEDLAYAKISDRLVNLFERLAVEFGPPGRRRHVSRRASHAPGHRLDHRQHARDGESGDEPARARGPDQTRGRLHHRAHPKGLDAMFRPTLHRRPLVSRPSLPAPASVRAGGSRAATLAPVYAASQGWLNGRLTPAEAAGKVVIVDVFTFDCYNCKNVVPNLRALNAKRPSDLVIVGIHSPETPYETNRANVIANLHDARHHLAGRDRQLVRDLERLRRRRVADATVLRSQRQTARDDRRRFAGRCGRPDRAKLLAER